MLPEASIAITKAKELAAFETWTFNPETAKTINKIITEFKTRITTFLEKKSIPCILPIALKLANLSAIFFLFFSEKKCIKKKTGIKIRKNKYCGCVNENIAI